MKNITLLLGALFFISCSQPKPQEIEVLKKPSSYFPRQKAKVLVVGTFHFNYPGLDAHKTEESDKIDVLKEPKKTEVSELVAYIKKFKPNKIAIEARDNWNAKEKFTKYKKGEFRDQRDERYQIAMRIASELHIDSLYSIDIESWDNTLEKMDSVYTEKLFKDFDFKSDDPFDEMVTDWIENEDKLKSKVKILDFFKHMNSRESHQYGYGSYLIGDFKLDDVRGADILSVWWYNRNLRIFRKLQQITDGPGDRILVVFGNGHAAILRQLLECSPEYDFIEFDSL